MTDAVVTWKQGIQFIGKGRSDLDLPLGGGPQDFSPLELLAMGLAGCTGMDVISILEKKRQVVSSFEIKVHADRSEEEPKPFSRARLEYIVSGQSIQEAAVVRSIELSVGRYCPAYAMFARIIPIDLEYSIYEDHGDGQRTLAVKGNCIPRAEPV